MVKLKAHFRSTFLKLNSLMSVDQIHESDFEYKMHTGSNNIVYFLHGFEEYLLNLIDKIFDEREVIENTVSRHFLENRIKFLLINIIFHPQERAMIETADKCFDELIRQVQQLNHCFVVLPVENIELPEDIKVGNISFKLKNEHNLTDYLEHISPRFRNITLKSFNTNIIAIAEVTAFDGDKIQEIAIEEVEKALNYIRGLLLPDYYSFGIPGYYNSLKFLKTAMFNSDITKTPIVKHQMKGSSVPFRFSTNEFERYKEKIDLLNQIAKIENKTEFQKKVLLALEWIGKITKDLNNVENLSRIYTALEVLVVKDYFEGKNETIAERIAFITGSNSTDRKTIYNKVKNILKARNTLIHDGHTKYNQREFNSVLLYSQLAIIKLLENQSQFTKMSDLINYILDLKFQ